VDKFKKKQWTKEIGQLKKVITLQTAMSKTGRRFFREKIGMTPSVAAPGDTNPMTPLSLQLTSLSTGQVTCITAQVRSMGFMHARRTNKSSNLLVWWTLGRATRHARSRK